MELFHVEINSAPADMLLKVPGIGVKSADRIMQARKNTRLDFDDLKRLRVVLKRAIHFITCKGKILGTRRDTAVKGLLSAAEWNENARQLSIFDNNPIAALSALNGEL